MQWIPEPKPPSGGLAAEGFYKLLGRPRLDPLTVLVRETAQNSWDARLPNDDPVLFSIQGWEISGDERASLRNDVFEGSRGSKVPGLDEALSNNRLIGLYITDRNTKGLSGPMHADEADPVGTYDWVDFVLNVGEANTQAHTGGTYGFGKTISYVVSSANSVVIHSRTKYRGRLETRLIACALGEKFERGGKLFTGRHWWGVDDSGKPSPLTGKVADELAEAIGMPTFEDHETGTNILILAPDLGGRTPEQAMRFIAESVTWHLWPKLMRHRGQPAMDIVVEWNGDDVSIAPPEDRPPLQGFSQAFQAILDAESGAKPGAAPGLVLDDIRCQRPSTNVGLLATVPLVHRDRVSVDDGSDAADTDAPRPAAVITGVCHHVALLRTPELVVEYMEGPPPPEGGVEWAGVFRASDAQDKNFAAAEPPTHDSWNPELLPKSTGRTVVNVGLREIRSSLERRWSQRRSSSVGEMSSTALVADELAHLVGAVDGRGKGRAVVGGGGGGGGGGGTPRAKVDLIFTRPFVDAGVVGTLARLLVSPVPGSRGTLVHFRVAAALDATTADDSLDPMLSVVEARFGDNIVPMNARSGELRIDTMHPVEMELRVRRGMETSVLFDVEAEPIS